MRLDSMQCLLTEQLRDIYNAEKQLLKVSPKVIDATTGPRLRAALERQGWQARMQVARLQLIFGELGMAPRGMECRGMVGLLCEWEAMAFEEGEAEVRDYAIIAGGRRVALYEMAAYDNARNLAGRLGLRSIVSKLEETFAEEVATNDALADLAEKDGAAQIVRRRRPASSPKNLPALQPV